MEDITKQEYSAWLEESLRIIIDSKPTSICVASRTEDDVLIGFWNASAQDKAVFAYNIQADVVMDVIRHNAEKIKEILEGDSDEEL